MAWRGAAEGREGQLWGRWHWHGAGELLPFCALLTWAAPLHPWLQSREYGFIMGGSGALLAAHCIYIVGARARRGGGGGPPLGAQPCKVAAALCAGCAVQRSNHHCRRVAAAGCPSLLPSPQAPLSRSLCLVVCSHFRVGGGPDDSFLPHTSPAGPHAHAPRWARCTPPSCLPNGRTAASGPLLRTQWRGTCPPACLLPPHPGSTCIRAASRMLLHRSRHAAFSLTVFIPLPSYQTNERRSPPLCLPASHCRL